MRYSALVTCITELEAIVEADTEEEARAKIEAGEFLMVELWDGGLDVTERFHDIQITEESFGAD
jgi:hypothetical protein